MLPRPAGSGACLLEGGGSGNASRCNAPPFSLICACSAHGRGLARALPYGRRCGDLALLSRSCWGGGASGWRAGCGTGGRPPTRVYDRTGIPALQCAAAGTAAAGTRRLPLPPIEAAGRRPAPQGPPPQRPRGFWAKSPRGRLPCASIRLATGHLYCRRLGRAWQTAKMRGGLAPRRRYRGAAPASARAAWQSGASPSCTPSWWGWAPS